jgi:hypothetical protein
MPFDPATAYAGNYAFLNFVETTSWIYGSGPTTVQNLKAQRRNIDTPDLVSVAAGLGLSSDAAAIAVWQATASTTFAPEPGHILSMATSGRWIIRSLVAVRFSWWLCLCEKEKTNADVT